MQISQFQAYIYKHTLWLCVCQTVPDKPRAQRQEWTQALVPWAQSGCVTEPRLWLAPHRVGFGAGTVSCHCSGGRVSQQGSSVGRGEGDKPQSPAPFGTSAWCCCSREPSSTSPKKGGHPSPAAPVPDPCPPVTCRDPERAFALHALHNPH